MQVVANLGAGLFDLNAPYFALYRDHLPAIERWTRERMQGRPGVCVPETMRFSGQGFEHEEWAKTATDCDAGSPPYYNARTLSTGAEVSFWICQQYQFTGDRRFLAENYPVMAAAARFLLAYAKRGTDGKLHTYPSNAHENLWDVHDPTTDISAMRTLFPIVAETAKLLGRDDELAKQATEAARALPPLPLQRVADGEIIAESYDPGAPLHNSENVGLEPVWPYALIGVSGREHQLGVRTFQHRRNKWQNDWSYDPLHAAHLGLADEMKRALREITEKYQTRPSGMAQFVGPEPYREQLGVTAGALQDALAHEFDGVLHIAPAWPKDWDADGTVVLSRASKVRVHMRHGAARAAIFEAGFSGTLHFQVAQATAAALEVEKGRSYNLLTGRRGAASIDTSGIPAAHVKRLGNRTIGLPRLIR